MATATIPGPSTSSRNVSHEERRWVVIGICLNKVLTPALRNVLGNEIPIWHQMLVKPPVEIDKQTYGKHVNNLLPSTIKLNYDSVNNNSVHKSSKKYDYAVKDPLSLAKLFVKPFMASFTGFDHTMDTSAVLSVMCEAQPFFPSGAAVHAKKIRSDIRNEWAHCDFSHWTEPNFQSALKEMESLIKTVGLPTADEKIVLDGIDNWRNNGIMLCFGGNLVDCELLDIIRTEVGNLQESVISFNEDSKDKKKLLDCLYNVQDSLSEEINELRENIGRLHNQYVSTVQDVEKIKSEVARIGTTNDEIPYLFLAPKQNPWFAGRSSEIQDLRRLLEIDDETAVNAKVNIAAICGLGGVGKTSLATEYAHQKKEFYTGGVYWFSGEDDTSFENSVYDVATRFGTFQSDSFGLIFSATLAMISRNKNPWLVVLDNMDQLCVSANIIKLVSGSWQHGAAGHLLITTRRNTTALANDIRDFDERCCLSLKCFREEEGKKFLFHRIGIFHDEEIDVVAEKLVQQLGGLPLALEQAGAYIRSLRCTLSQYLELYNSQRLRLLNKQKVTRASDYESAERLAVRTTWHLNFEHIKQTVDDGKAATRFLYACAFLNPNEIQKDLINVGEPPVEDEEFNECVKTTLGCQQISKLLTDFSLFKESPSSNLSVHHLVQEVIQDNLNPQEEIQTIIDAIRMLRYAFLNCSSPDDLLSAISNDRRERPSIVSVDQSSRFYMWHKLCLHSYELVKHLKRVVRQSDSCSGKILSPETARVVYECAIHLSANSKHDEAKEVANFAYHIFHLSNQQVPAGQSNSLFPHQFPLPKLVRRHIQYSCNTPATIKQDGCRDGVRIPSYSLSSEELTEMRMKGNDFFKKGMYKDALKMYSDAINMSKNTDFFDVTLLSNRASVYLKLEQYAEALQDADEYILQRPKCWKGYARKALALVELKDMYGASVAASLAYYYERNVFRNFEPFRRKFDFFQQKRVFVCRSNSDLSNALSCLEMFHFTNYEDLPVIILEPGDYVVSLQSVDAGLFNCNGKLLLIGNLILVGGEDECCVTFDSNLINVFFCKVFIAYNVNFRSHFTNCHFQPGSVVKLSRCSFKSTNNIHTSFCCKGQLHVDLCKFHNCATGGLLVVGEAEVVNSEFYGNGNAGLEVREGGRLVVRKSKMYANKQGLMIGPQVKECVVEDCDLYDNEWGGIVVANCMPGVTIKGNRIYDNDEPGICVMEAESNAHICENEIFKNRHFGISIHKFCQAVVKNNQIHSNTFGGVCVEAISSPKKSVTIEYNDIFNNSGPGIHEEGSETMTKYTENKLCNNKEKRNQSTARSGVRLCYNCRKAEEVLRKCGKCFTAEYCGPKCQKSHWKNHKSVCDRLLSDASILLKYVREPIMERHKLKDCKLKDVIGTRAPGLLPVGPKYCTPPDTTKTFIVKMSAGVQASLGREDPSVVRLYDRSLSIDGILTGADRIYHVVQQHGAMGQLFNKWKKLFMWVKGPEDGKLRVFINEFPPYQYW